MMPVIKHFSTVVFHVSNSLGSNAITIDYYSYCRTNDVTVLYMRVRGVPNYESDFNNF